jgi:hypothetical protein
VNTSHRSQLALAIRRFACVWIFASAGTVLAEQADCSSISRIVDASQSRFRSLPGLYDPQFKARRLSEVVPGASKCDANYDMDDVTCHYLFASSEMRQAGKDAITALLRRCVPALGDSSLEHVPIGGGKYLRIYQYDDQNGLDLNLVFTVERD